MGPGPWLQNARFACATPLRYVGNFRPEKLGPPLDQILDPHLGLGVGYENIKSVRMPLAPLADLSLPEVSTRRTGVTEVFDAPRARGKQRSTLNTLRIKIANEYAIKEWGRLLVGEMDVLLKQFPAWKTYVILCDFPWLFQSAGFPFGLENLEKWEGIFQSGKSQEILNRLEKSGKSQGKPHKILENWDKLR